MARCCVPGVEELSLRSGGARCGYMQYAGGGGGVLGTVDHVWVHAVCRGQGRYPRDWGPGVGTCSVQGAREVS